MRSILYLCVFKVIGDDSIELNGCRITIIMEQDKSERKDGKNGVKMNVPFSSTAAKYFPQWFSRLFTSLPQEIKK